MTAHLEFRRVPGSVAVSRPTMVSSLCAILCIGRVDNGGNLDLDHSVTLAPLDDLHNADSGVLHEPYTV